MIETERLSLMPLTAHQLRLWIENISALEKDLNCTYQGEPLAGMFLGFLKEQLEIVAKYEATYLYHSFWLILRKTDRVVIGSTCFKGNANDNNEVEIGYGLGKEFEGNGYMTEAVKAICGWALEQEAVSHVIAETDADNYKSQQILERCGFSCYEKADTLWWRI
jgi:RimJ/RimL family protein N-acetyltransferase